MGRGRFPGGPGGKNMNNMMKQMQKLQRQMEQMQEELDSQEIEATAGGGAIKAVVNGKKELLKIELDESIVDPEDIEMLEDLIVVCINQAMQEADKKQNEGMSKLTGGLNIPGL
ncbi:MAG: YbaB/EbfC family nucleoid-associated protein [Tissierellia bacterium]|nr:YbaB/EbfC family nucleoid-associated protein [Tissierellia bacterium]